MTVTMYDSVDVGTVPANPQAVAGYTSGNWPTYNALVAKFPQAHHLSIAVSASHDADCLDVEPGDATVAEAPAWVRRQHARGLKLPVLYTSLSNVNALLAALAGAGIKRSEVLIWSAHYSGIAHICGPSEGMNGEADATQYWDKALARNLDVSLVKDSFFGVAPKPKPPYVPGDEVNWVREWNKIVGRKTIAAHIRRVFLKAKMVHRERQMVDLVKVGDGTWATLNRKARYEKLLACTQTR